MDNDDNTSNNTYRELELKSNKMVFIKITIR